MARIAVVLMGSFVLGLSFLASGQDINRCLTTENENQRHARSPRRESTAQFETWMQSRIANRGSSPGPSTTAVYTIPVVVHVIHNGINDITNISDAQVLSQIDVLNKDFNRLNTDAANTPAEFQSVAGSISIEFVLAKRDPEGRSTNGIVRVQGTKQQWTLADQSEFKSLSYWPAEDYLNIWVINFGTNDLGFAQFPVSNTLAGLEAASDDRLTDGVVIDYQAFGTIDAGSFPLQARFNKGRTATHEIGHFLGLRHIWGDGNSCDATDYVADTPSQPTPTSFCPTYPALVCSPSHSKMFMNYMDYTDDACMNIFSVGQFGRVQVVLGESPRRVSLLTSLGATPPVTVTNDLGIRSIISPTSTACAGQVTPTIEVRNYGTNTISSGQVSMSINGILTDTQSLTAALPLQGITTLMFSPVTLPSPGSPFLVEFQVTQTNGGADGNSQNDHSAVSVTIPQQASLPIEEPFNSLPTGWVILNPDNQITWSNALAPDNTFSNRAMKLDFYNYENEGVIDWMLTPSFSLTTPANAQLKFDVAYAQFDASIADRLKVYALPGCSQDLSQAVLLYDKAGSSLATSTTTTNPFVPNNNSQWRKPEVVSLIGLNTNIPWQIAFVGYNAYGNNLYVDNVLVTEDEISDIALAGVVSPGIVHCLPNPTIQFKVTNLGTSAVTKFRVDYKVNGGMNTIQQFTNLLLNVGETKTFILNPIALQPGPNEVFLSVSLPNGIPDILSNNSLTLVSVLDQTLDRAPLRVTFDNPAEKSWRVASPVNALDWESVLTNKDRSLSYKSYTNPNVGQESWLVSPSLDLRAGDFTLFFDVSYAQNLPADDRLMILASTDCGNTYPQVIMNRAASSFTSNSSSSEWSPGTNTDWQRQYVNIQSLAGLANVRLAFVALNDNGNNLYIDNIEMFSGDDTNPPVVTAPYLLYYSTRNPTSEIALTFHLGTRQDVPLQIINMQGVELSERTLDDVLNQTYYFDLSNQSAGIYLFRMIIDGKPSVTKVFIGH